MKRVNAQEIFDNNNEDVQNPPRAPLNFDLGIHIVPESSDSGEDDFVEPVSHGVNPNIIQVLHEDQEQKGHQGGNIPAPNNTLNGGPFSSEVASNLNPHGPVHTGSLIPNQQGGDLHIPMSTGSLSNSMVPPQIVIRPPLLTSNKGDPNNTLNPQPLTAIQEDLPFEDSKISAINDNVIPSKEEHGDLPDNSTMSLIAGIPGPGSNIQNVGVPLQVLNLPIERKRGDVQNAMEEASTLATKTKGKFPPNRLNFQNPRYFSAYERGLDMISEEDRYQHVLEYFIPPSMAAVNNVAYDLFGFTLNSVTNSPRIGIAILRGLAKAGFEIPEPLLEFDDDVEPLPFEKIKEILGPYLSIQGPAIAAFTPLLPPRTPLPASEIKGKKVNFQALQDGLGLFPHAINHNQYLEELISITYLKRMVREKVTHQKVISAFKVGLDRAYTANQQAKKELEEFVNQPMTFIKKFPGGRLLPLKGGLELIGPSNRVQQVSYLTLAKANRTNPYLIGPDTVMGYIMGNLVATQPPAILLQIASTNYVGTGKLSMAHERYTKSLQIYREANNVEQVAFHKQYYAQEFSNFMKSFGYTYNGVKYPIPKDEVEFFGFTDPQGGSLFHPNPHSKGNFTSFQKRRDTALVEAATALGAWTSLENDKSNPGFKFFDTGFKFISAKLKAEIHSYDKPPRFYNPTAVAVFLPIQFVFNIFFTACPPRTSKCPYSLLGIEDVGHQFHDVMASFVQGDRRYHYSDNFWVSEDSKMVSVDVERCDSNLSREALLYPLLYCGEAVLDPIAFKKFSIIAHLFVDNIPREAILSITLGKAYQNIALPFYWLPSGVVGTAYYNHLYTGFFLYYTKEVRWIAPNGELTPLLQEKAKKFGIHLEVASFVDLSKIQLYDLVPFDLLARSGYFVGGTHFIPVLAPDRVYKALCFQKKDKYEEVPLVNNFVRLAKIQSLMTLGAHLHPYIREVIYASAVAFSSILRDDIHKITGAAAAELEERLAQFNLDLAGIQGFTFQSFIPDIPTYVKEKLPPGLQVPLPQDWIDYDNEVGEKIFSHQPVWSALLPVVRGISKDPKIVYQSNQRGPSPYWIGHYYPWLMKGNAKTLSLKRIATYAYKWFGEQKGGTLIREIITMFTDYRTAPMFKEATRAFKEGLYSAINTLIAKGMSKTQGQEYFKKVLATLYKPGGNKLYTAVERPDKGEPYIYIVFEDKALSVVPRVLNRVDFSWLNPLDPFFVKASKLSKIKDDLNFLVSQVFFEGSTVPSIGYLEGIRRQGAVSKYRDLPIVIQTKRVLDPVAMKAMNQLMLIKGVEPVAGDLGFLTGLVTMLTYQDIGEKVANDQEKA